MTNALNHLKPQLEIDFAQKSDAGVKPENQDTIGARIPTGSALISKGIAIAIADGVSSSDAAKQASQLAITGFLSDYYATPDTWRTQKCAVQVIQSLNRYLWAQSQNSVRQEGHLTTFSALIIKGDTLFSFHIGDSRIYRLRDHQLEQLTRDHTQRIDKQTQYLSRALGADPTLEIDMYTCEIQEDDIYLLTTDGVHDVVAHGVMEQLVTDNQHSMEQLIQQLFEQSVIQNSQDNISLQACKIVRLGPASQSDAVTNLSQLPFPPFLEVGQTLDGLKVRKVLHESERSQVYLVSTEEGRQLVMKTPSINYQDDPVYIERFVLEQWVGSRIQSSNVVKVVEPPKGRSFLYYLTEYIEGPTLSQLIRERAPMEITDAIELTDQMIKATRAFHRKDSLHQDIKPENIVIGPNGATLIDFGSCWVAGINELKAPFTRDTILGTMDYSAPEYRYDGPKSARSDQFSLGVILYEMLTGQKPYGEAYANATHPKALAKLRYTAASTHNALIPTWLDKALEKAVSISPETRYEALSEWYLDLKRPNPSWNSTREGAFLNRDPVLFWKLAAILGWFSAVVILLYSLKTH